MLHRSKKSFFRVIHLWPVVIPYHVHLPALVVEAASHTRDIAERRRYQIEVL